MTRTLFHGGHVYTPAHPVATALAIENGTVTWTGDDPEAAQYADNADVVVELGGRLVTPAFVDSHVHLSQTGMAAHSVDLSEAASMTAALEALERHARQISFPIVLGFGWDDTGWPEGRCFTRPEVDRAVGGRPAYLARVDAHSAVVSTAFLDGLPALSAMAGYSSSGLLRRAANIAAREAVFTMVPGSAQEDAIARALADAARMGIAMVHEMGAPGDSPAEDFARITTVSAAGPLPEVIGYWGQLDGIDQARELGCVGAAGDLCMDGAIGSRTAAMYEPYADAPTRGHTNLDVEQVSRHVMECTRAGMQAGFHVIGDRAVAEVIQGFRQAAQVLGVPAVARARHRLEHLEMIGPEDIATLARLGVTASMQPMFDGLWGGPDALYAQRLGAERARPMNAFGALSAAGVPLAFGSDTPVTRFAPWAGVRAAAWHHTEEQRITVGQAFDAHTRGGWRAARRDEGGIICAGAPASIAVWDWTEPGLPELHPQSPVPACLLTLVAGRTAFAQPGALG